MVQTIMNLQAKVEVWRNTAAGMRWYIVFDLQGRETSKTVPGGKTFTVTTFERQINQERAASPEQDLFRNGTFVLAKASDDTDESEFASPNARTDAEIEAMVNEVVYGELDVKAAIGDIDSIVTLGRILEALVIEDAKKSVIDQVKKKMKDLDPAAPVERERVSTGNAPTTRQKG